MARSPSIFLQREEEDIQLARVAFERLSRMSPQIVQSSSLVIVVEAPFVAEMQTAVQLEVVPVHQVSVRRWIVLQKPRIIALMQSDAIEARPHAVPPAGMMLMQCPTHRSRSDQRHNHPTHPRAPFHHEKASSQYNHHRQRPTLREIKTIQRN